MSDTTTTKKSRPWKFLLVIVPIAFTLLPLWFFIFGPQLRHDRLMEKGIRAQGRLLNVDETGTVVNDSPEL